MKKHILLINTKAYKEGTGRGALELARICKRLGGGPDIIMAVQPSDIPNVSGTVTTFAQHVDPVSPGSHTGHILPEAVKAAGAKGTLLSHSERRMSRPEIRDAINRAKSMRLTTVCCVPDTGLVRKIASLNPDYIAIEPPELIGTGISVSQAKPEVISKAVDIAKKANPRVKVLCGAGISTGNDVSRALELGASGVLLASSVVKARRPEKAIKDILRGF